MAGYSYADHKHWTLTDEGQRKTIEVMRAAEKACDVAGIVMAGKILGAGDVWHSMAAIDRLVEMGVLSEVPQESPLGQHRLFVWVKA